VSFGSLTANWTEVRARVQAAARRSGRTADEVRVIAVTKTLPAEAVVAAALAGATDIGENYVQEAMAKQQAVADALGAGGTELRWHMIGRLQSNKAARAARAFAFIHGVDSLSVVRAVSRAAGEGAPVADLLLQIKLGGAAVRGGIDPSDAETFLRQAAACPGVRFVGVMGVADPARPAQPQFARLRELAQRLRALQWQHAPMTEISAGMSGDFEDAVAEGATMVRIGTALFGAR